MKHFLIQYITGNRQIIEFSKLLLIGMFAVVSLFVSVYFLYFSPYVGFRFVYVFIPHLYLIPIILLALWYPKSALKLVIFIFCTLGVFWFFADTLGYKFPPFFAILYTGIDLAGFVVFLLYVKDRRLVEAVILDLIERGYSDSEQKETTGNRFGGDFDAIIKALGSEEELLREEAVAALAEIGDDRVIFPLITALRDVKPHIRRDAAEALGNIGSIKGIKPLMISLADDDRYVREASAEALGHIGKGALPSLVQGLTNEDWRVRAGSLIALRVYPDMQELDPVIRILPDQSVYVRREAVKTLGRIGDRRILPYLVEATRDPDPGVRLRAVRAVAKIGSKEEVLPILRRCMQDPDSAVKIRAGEELNKIYSVAEIRQ
jgi:hypothetical protein